MPENDWAGTARWMASGSCQICRGAGLVPAHKQQRPCGCVLRSIFCACYNRFREADTRKGFMYRIFRSDFCLIAARTLAEADRALFRLFFLRERPWHECVGPLGLDRGNFFHRVYVVEQRLGRAFHDTEPYPLWPLAPYFASSSRFTAPSEAHGNGRNFGHGSSLALSTQAALVARRAAA